MKPYELPPEWGTPDLIRRDVAVRRARRLQVADPRVQISFCYRCASCKQWLILDPPHVLPGSAECAFCGHVQELRKVAVLALVPPGAG